MDEHEQKREQQTATDFVYVAVDEHHLGHLYREPGASFDLSNVYDRSAGILGSDRFTTVHFKTKSGNIYRLARDGALVNGKESQRTGKVAETLLEPDDLAKLKLTVGEPFSYGKGGHTTEVTTIVPSTDKYYDTAYLHRMVNGKRVDILDQYTKLVPEQAEPNAALDKLRQRVGR